MKQFVMIFVFLVACAPVKLPIDGLSSEAQVVHLKVDGIDYVPSEIYVKRGPVKLVVDGSDAVGCVQYFTIPEFGISTKLGKEDVFEFTADKLGTIHFSCSMNMARGKIFVVDELPKSAGSETISNGILPGGDMSAFTFKQWSAIDASESDVIQLSADIINYSIGSQDFKMYGYNSMIPGPLLRVKQGSTVYVNFTNNIDMNTTIHWHGLRHNVKDDGVPGVSQSPVMPGASHLYTLFFPDSGIFWYHPHVREDIQQDAGLSGNMLVISDDEPRTFDREELLLLDDILIEDGLVPYGSNYANFAIMGRFGNTMLVNGKTDYSLNVKRGETIRFYITNVANVRPFNISFGAPVRLVGSDLGKYERAKLVDSVIIAPAERYFVEAQFSNSGEYVIKNINPEKSYDLGVIKVSDESVESPLSFNETSYDSDFDAYRQYFDAPVDYELELTIDMPGMIGMEMDDAHGIEWEDSMRLMNEISTSENLRWIIKDKSGRENMNLTLSAKVGDKIKIRLVNKKDSMHPMQHPIHLHGQRFLVLDGSDLVWKDTVLVPIGETKDILVDVTNPGEWMMHCHIAEHLESGMMTSLEVME